MKTYEKEPMDADGRFWLYLWSILGGMGIIVILIFMTSARIESHGIMKRDIAFAKAGLEQKFILSPSGMHSYSTTIWIKSHKRSQKNLINPPN